MKALLAAFLHAFLNAFLDTFLDAFLHAFFERFSLNFYLDIQNAYGYQTQLAPILLVETDESGNPVQDPNDPSRYATKLVENASGIIQPTIGIVIEFNAKK